MILELVSATLEDGRSNSCAKRCSPKNIDRPRVKGAFYRLVEE